MGEKTIVEEQRPAIVAEPCVESPAAIEAKDISIEIVSQKDGLPVKFVVRGGSVFRMRIDENRSVDLTLNGTYCRTPNSTYSCVQTKATGKDVSYQVLLLPLPKPHAQIEVLRMHSGFLDADRLVEGLGEAGYETLVEREPLQIFEKVRKELSSNLPHFVLYATKSRSS
jgi:hypothetical protein